MEIDEELEEQLQKETQMDLDKERKERDEVSKATKTTLNGLNKTIDKMNGEMVPLFIYQPKKVAPRFLFFLHLFYSTWYCDSIKLQLCNKLTNFWLFKFYLSP